MKKIISLLTVVLFSVAAFAQDTTSKSNSSMGRDSVPNIGKDSALRNSGDNTTTAKTPDSTSTGSTSMQSSTMDTTAKMQQQTTSGAGTTSTDTASHVAATDRVVMKDDKMYMVKSGDSSLLEKSYKLESGAMVSTTGLVKYPSGKTVQLKNGQFIELKPKTTEAKKATVTKKSTSVTKKRTS